MTKKSFRISEYKSLFGILFTGILIIIFYNKSMLDKERYYQTINELNKLKEINSTLNGNLFLTQFNRIKHYDLIRKNIQDLNKRSEKLKELSGEINYSAFKYNLNKYLSNLEEKENSLNNFISHFAVYKNFIAYYPKLSDDLSNKFKEKNNELATDLLRLQNAILIYNYDDKLNFVKVLEKISKVSDSLGTEDKKELLYLINYTNKLLENKTMIENYVKSFLLIDLAEDINLLISNYDFYQNSLDMESKKYNYLMMILVCSLFLWTIYFFINLNRANRKTKDAMNELNFQKSALDEHAIVSITDAKGNITYVNDKFCKISGYEEKELIGKNHRVLKSDEHDKDFFKTLWFVITSGKTWRGEVKNRKKDGSFYWVSATVVPFLDEFGKPFQYISIRTDITKRKIIEEDLIEAKIKADESNQVKGQFLANMSHELRTPLNGVIGMAHIALENEKDKKQKVYLEKINVSANILLKIINDLLDYSKIEAGKLPIENIEFSIDALLQSVADLVSVKAYEKDLELYFNRDMRIPKTLIGDSLRISQVLVNIIGNSIKFTESGEVSLDIKFYNSKDNLIYLQFIIKDSGIGMDEKTLKNVFNSFTQADASTSRKYGGTGLGLTITKNLVELMGGTIEVESELGFGTSFIVSLPFDYKENEQNIDYNLTKNVYVKLYKLSTPILDSLKKILSSLKIDYEEIEYLDFPRNSENKYIVISEEEESFETDDSISILYLNNPNKSINTPRNNTKIITKPINPSIIYDSILEFLNLDEESFSTFIKQKSKRCQNVEVLLVEDNEINQLVATTFLESFGCKVTLANNGLEAIELIKANNSFDIIFMDVQMPIMNGYDATRIIRKELKMNIPIIAMTANAMNEDIIKSKEAGMDKHIGKPIEPNEIEKAIAIFVLNKRG